MDWRVLMRYYRVFRVNDGDRRCVEERLEDCEVRLKFALFTPRARCCKATDKIARRISCFRVFIYAFWPAFSATKTTTTTKTKTTGTTKSDSLDEEARIILHPLSV